MTKIIAYIRTSTDKQELNNQKLAILEYAQQDKPPIGGSLAFYISCQLLLSKVICKSLQIIRVKDGNNR